MQDRKDYLLPMPFIFSGMVNMILLTFGLGGKESSIRPLIFTALGVLIFLNALYGLSGRLFHPGMVATLLSAGAYGVLYLWAFYRNGINRIILDRFLRFGVFGLTSYGIGAYMMREKKEDRMFLLLEKLSWLLVPAGILYIMKAVSMSGVYWDRNLGAMTYMALAYTWMPALFAICINLARDGFGPLHFHFGKKNFSLPLFFRMALGVFFWFVIQVSSTRGAILGTLLFIVLFFLYTGLHIKEKKRKQSMVWYLISLLFLFGLLNFSRIPLNIEISDRMDDFVQSISHGEIQTSERGVLTDEDIEALVEDPAPLENPYWREKDLVTAEGNRLNVGDRMSLYRLSFAEWKNSPLKGMGPFGFQLKYGLYPHDFLLELVTELGAVVGLALCVGVVFLFFRLWFVGGKDEQIRRMLLFIAGHLLMVLVSGTYWDMPFLFFGLGYALYLTQRKKTL